MIIRLRSAPVFIVAGLVGLAVTLCLPAAASAAAPVVVRTSVQATGFTTATLTGDIDPQLDATTTYAVEWDVQSSAWCTGGGQSGSPANSTSPKALGSNAALEVGVELTGLSRFTTYCARFIATNGDGEGVGSLVTWQQDPPVVDTLDGFSTSAATATVDIAINPEGIDTSYDVGYGLASSTWCTSKGQSGPTPNISDPADLGFTDSTAHDVSVKLFQLETGAEYCARGEAISTGGAAVAPTFVTFTVDKPGAVTGDISSTGGTTATVMGLVNPNGQTTTYQVRYDLAGSSWCTSGGTSGSPAHTTAPATLGSTDEEFLGVSVDVTGLTPPNEYCAQLIASNGKGEVDGSQVAWTQGIAPDAVTFDTYSTGATTATIEGLINVNAETTTYVAQYDTADSEWCTSGGTSGSPANTTAPTSEGLDLNSTDYQYLAIDLNSGLTGGQDYCGQIVASNTNGDADGGQVFWTQGAPTTDTFDVNPTGPTTATVDGDVNPAESATTYWVEYGLASSDWCVSGGLSGSPAGTTVPTQVDPVDDQFHDVSVDLTGLAADTGYCADVIALNNDGSGESFQVSWTQPPQPTLTVNSLGTGWGTVTSSPAGLDCGATCSARFEVGTQVTLTATAAVGSTFVGWSGGGCSGSGTCAVTLNSDTTVTANFFQTPPAPAPKCVVPNVKGKTLAAARKVITKHHCGVGKITKVKSSSKSKGHVISQSPKPGKHLKKGSKVALKVGR